MNKTNYEVAANLIKKRFSIQSFNKYFLNSKQNISQLNKMIKNCKVDDIECRFNVWRLCLGIIYHESSIKQKKQQIQTIRKSYQQKKQQALKIFKKNSPIKQQKKNPLMMLGIKSQSKQTESDEFLKQQIQKDVERTYQEIPFFQNKDILKLLNLILFVWCRRNPEVSYKQGMNELLASVVVCYFQEAEFKTLHDRPEDVQQELWQNHLFFNSADYAEADIYSVFEKIINIQGDMYKTQADQCIKSKVNPNSKNNTPILQRIIQIKDHKLKHMDLELFRVIKLQDVQTKSFMLRWIRCMHTREFSLQNSFVIWDSIFLQYMQSPQSKKKGQFQFIDAMCLAMFIYMRSIVFTKETSGEILQVYQKYPALKRGDYLDELISLAWTVCEQLRLEDHNANQNNVEFDVTDRLKDMKFMNKGTSLKNQTKQNKVIPKINKVSSQTDAVKKTLNKQTQNKVKKQKQLESSPIKITQNGHSQKISQVTSPIVEQKQQTTQIISDTNNQPEITQKAEFNLAVKQIKQPQPISVSIPKTEIHQMINDLNTSLASIRNNNLDDITLQINKVIKTLEERLKVSDDLLN